MTFLVDIDDTITNHCHVWFDWLNDLYGLNIKYSDATFWDYPRTLSLTEEELFAPHNMKEFWDEVTIYPNAVKFLEELVTKGHKVYLVTASYPSDMLGYKIRKTLEAFNPGLINTHNIIIAHDKDMIIGDVLIDDKIETCKKCYGNNVLFTHSPNQPWNMGKGFYNSSDICNDLNTHWLILRDLLNYKFNL